MLFRYVGVHVYTCIQVFLSAFFLSTPTMYVSTVFRLWHLHDAMQVRHSRALDALSCYHLIEPSKRKRD